MRTDYTNMTKKEYSKKYQLEHKREISLQRKKYRQEHKKQIKKQKHQDYLKNKEKYLKRAKKYGKIYYKLNKDKVAKIHKKYYQKNKDKIIKYNKNRRKTDINFKLRHQLATRIWLALKKNYKSERTMTLIGCTIDLLRLHLQSKFQPGMSFSNYGKWHIDHIRPCVSFNLSKPKEQRKCFNYKNLQPLWAYDNLSKNRY